LFVEPVEDDPPAVLCPGGVVGLLVFPGLEAHRLADGRFLAVGLENSVRWLSRDFA
jgi:hypothetical protein